jgi:hypothetical protein
MVPIRMTKERTYWQFLFDFEDARALGGGAQRTDCQWSLFQ